MKLETLEKILDTLRVEPEDFFRFLSSLDESGGPREIRERYRIDDRLLADAFQSLHAAIDGLREAVERAMDPDTSPRLANTRPHKPL